MPRKHRFFKPRPAQQAQIHQDSNSILQIQLLRKDNGNISTPAVFHCSHNGGSNVNAIKFSIIYAIYRHEHEDFWGSYNAYPYIQFTSVTDDSVTFKAVDYGTEWATDDWLGDKEVKEVPRKTSDVTSELVPMRGPR